MTEPAQMMRPLFVIGTGRSGTTLVFDLLSRHPDLGWVSPVLAGRRTAALQSPYLRLRRSDRFRQLVRRVGLDGNEAEPYDFWSRFVPGFAEPCRDLTEHDLPMQAGPRVVAAMAEHVAAMGRDRLLSKYTGWARIRLVDAIFPDALYLNVVRDGRAVAWSLMNQPWWRGWGGPGQWRWGPLAPEDERTWMASERSFYVLAGLQWRLLMDNLRAEGGRIGDRYRELRYEDLLARPEGVTRDVVRWAGLADSQVFFDEVREMPVRDGRGGWQTGVCAAEQERFNRALGADLARYDYR